MKKKTPLPKTVFQLGLVSLFNDLAKEMIYPVVPLFLAQVLGAGPVAVGWVEGVAESTSSFIKVFSGIGADKLKKRKPFIIVGFAMSTLLRPLVGLARTWPWVLFLRFADRLGKGVRSAPQDALITDVTNKKNRGASYGFHSAMDDAGQLLGPLVAGALLSPLIGLNYQNVILLSIVPGIMAWGTVWRVQEPSRPSKQKKKDWTLFQDWKALGGHLKSVLAILLIFTLGNSSDAFLMLRLSQVGVSNWMIALLWGLHGGVRMVASLYGGPLSDRLGRRPLIISGWVFYALVYFGFAVTDHPLGVIALFLVYGVFYGLCEPSEKAYIGDLAPKQLRGTAFGYYNLVMAFGALPASLIFGFLGQHWGYPAAFAVGGGFALASSLLLLFLPRGK